MKILVRVLHNEWVLFESGRDTGIAAPETCRARPTCAGDPFLAVRGRADCGALFLAVRGRADWGVSYVGGEKAMTQVWDWGGSRRCILVVEMTRVVVPLLD